MRRRDTALLLLSAAVLAYQVVLVRAFAIGQWHHFAYMVISIALLGFGASGTWLAALAARESRRSRPDAAPARERPGWFAAAATLFALTLPLSFALAQQIPFDPFLIVWDRGQWLALGMFYLVLFVPFFFAGLATGVALTGETERSTALYAFNLVGAGAGATFGVALLGAAPVEIAALVVGALAQGAAALALADAAQRLALRRRAQLGAAAGLAAMLATTLYFLARPPAVRLSQYKGLSYALNLPAAERLATRSSALGRVDVVASPAIRIAPGLSLVAPCEAAPPPQHGLFVDAEAAGAITAFDGDAAKLAYLDWMTTAAPYFARARPPERALVLGAGGGAGVLLALRHGAGQVDAVELDPSILALLRGEFRGWSGTLYDRPGVRVHRAEARAFAEGHRAAWDVVDLSLVDSFAAAAAGVGAVGESYLYTREALATFVERLAPGGQLGVTRWVRTPPRDELKLFATAVAALESLGLHPAERLAMVRSWATVTLLVKREPFTADEIAALRRWCEDRLFDTVYSPGIEPGQSNVFNLLERDYYAEGAAAVLAGGAAREQFFRDYAFEVRPATDDRPYFFHFFRWQALPEMLRSAGAAWVPFVEWGYIILVATLAQAALASAVLIALPLVLLRKKDRGREVGRPEGQMTRLQVFVYFLALGLGFLFVEMVLIQRLVFFLANPVYAVAVVLAGLLVFSGLGSAWAARGMGSGSGERLASAAAFGVAALAVLYAAGLHAALKPLIGLPHGARVTVALAALLPLGAMGIPFPLGLRALGRSGAELLPWAWAINGCASVVATALATMLGMGAGLRAVLLAAAACYVAAALTARRWSRAPASPASSLSAR
jgi:hypothetical protein